MKSLIVTGLGAGLLLAGSALGAAAMPLGAAPASAPLMEHVAQGCGPGFFRGPAGFCRPMGRRFYGPRPFYGRPFYGPRPYAYRRPYGPRFYRY